MKDKKEKRNRERQVESERHDMRYAQIRKLDLYLEFGWDVNRKYTKT